MTSKSTSTTQGPAGRAKGRPRSSSGVIATLERLTGTNPCPSYLRDAAYKYLRTELFGKTGGPEFKLGQPGAHTLLMNALKLDELLLGDTASVIDILRGQRPVARIAEQLASAEQDLQARLQVYVRALDSLPAIKAALSSTDIDLRQTRLDRLAPDAPTENFPLRAVRRLEAVERRRSGVRLNANACVEHAEAYLALGDYRAAAERARWATEQDTANAKAWFIQVVAALKLRDAAASQMMRHQMEATEMAEPMSAHESMAYSLRNEAGEVVSRHQQSLAHIVPQALLHWPRSGPGRYEHHRWLTQVQSMLIRQVFAAVLPRSEVLLSSQAFAINGLGPEWHLRYEQIEFPCASADAVKLPISATQRAALDLAFEEHRRHPNSFFAPTDRKQFETDFMLLHLRWILDNDGYEAHWKEWASTCSHLLPATFEREVIGNPTLALLWLGHQARHGGLAAAQALVEAWLTKARAEHDAQTRSAALRAYFMLYHHMLARQDHGGCSQVCKLGEEMARGIGRSEQAMPHPLEDMITVPVHRALFWQYLRALSVIRARHAGEALDDEDQELLAHQAQWQEAFSDVHACFWTMCEAYEGGGGEDYPVEPYGVDLRDASAWVDGQRKGQDTVAFDFEVHRAGDSATSA